MTRIDFYILTSSQEASRFDFAARLCEKAYRQNWRALILTPDEDAAGKVSQTFWHFRPESFLAHSILGQTELPSSIRISAGADDADHHDLLINLTQAVPPMFSRFKRMAEIVVQSPDVLAGTRQNYSFYKKRGYPVITNNIK